MRRVIIFLFAIGFLGLASQAQETNIKKERKRILKEQRQMETLNLDGNQGQQVKAINSRYRTAHKEIMKNETLTQEQKQEQVQALNKRRVEEIHNIVGREKTQEWDRIKQQEKEKKDAIDKEKKEKKEKKIKKADKVNKGNKGRG